MNVYQDILNYVSRPYFYRNDESLSLSVLSLLGKILALKFILVLIAYSLTMWLFSIFGVEPPTNTRTSFEAVPIRRFVIIAILAPFLEELIFRSWLRFKWGLFYIFPLTLFFSILLLGHFFGWELQSSFIWVSLIAYFACIFIVRKNLSHQEAEPLVQALFPYAFWGSTLFFALLHLTNYKVDEIGILGILMVLPQFIAGTIYGYVVMRFGFLAACLCHMVWNGSLVILAISLSN